MKCFGMFFVRPKGSKLFKRRILRHITTLQLYCVFILGIKLCLILRSLLVFGQGSNKFGYRLFLKVNNSKTAILHSSIILIWKEFLKRPFSWETFFCRTHSHVPFWGHWYPCFGFLVTSPLGFKARVGSALFALRRRM